MDHCPLEVGAGVEVPLLGPEKGKDPVAVPGAGVTLPNTFGTRPFMADHPGECGGANAEGNPPITAATVPVTSLLVHTGCLPLGRTGVGAKIEPTGLVQPPDKGVAGEVC